MRTEVIEASGDYFRFPEHQQSDYHRYTLAQLHICRVKGIKLDTKYNHSGYE